LGMLMAAFYVCYDQQTAFASIMGYPIVALGYAFLVLAAISEHSILYKWKSTITSHIATLSFGIIVCV
jgi:hypothetical protein